MLEEQRKRALVPILKNKGLKRKTWEREVEVRLREEVTICEPKYGFM